MAEKDKENGNGVEARFKAGQVEATIWRNSYDGEKGKFDSYSVTLSKSYHDDKSGEWKKTGSLSVNDVPKAVVALQKAFEYMVLRE